MIKCPDCGYPNPDDRTDCFKCGTSLLPADAAQQTPAPDPPPRDTAQPDLAQQAPQQAVAQQVAEPPPSQGSVVRFCPQCGASARDADICPKCGSSTLTMPAKDQTANSIASIVLGVIALATCRMPIIGIPIAAIGVLLGMRGLKSANRWMAIGGVAVSAVSLAVALYCLSCVASIVGSKYD